MPTISGPEVERYALTVAKGRLDPEARRTVDHGYEEHVAPRRRPLAPFALRIEGRDFRSLFDVIVDRSVRGASGEIRLGGPVGGTGWEFVIPFRRVVLRDDGTGELVSADGEPPRRAVVRWLLRSHLALGPTIVGAPGELGRPGPHELFGTLEEEILLARSTPLLPLGLALLLYLPGERIRYELDLVHNVVVADPRAGRFAPARRVARTSRFSWGLDRKIGRSRLPLVVARVLELLAETHGLTALELAHLLGGTKEAAEAALRTLGDHHLVTVDARTARYHAELEAFLPRPDPRSAPDRSGPEPALRTSVRELLDAADARATCPLCGNAMSGSRDRLICDNCAKTVGLA